MRWIADFAWLGGDSLERDVLLEVENGRFTDVVPNSAESPGSPIHGLTLPGMVNAHSHAFHRMLRGRTQIQGGDFWAWRDLMFQVAAELTPETYEEIATDVYLEMAQAGFTTVGEFHYLHHQPGGRPYDDPNEMGHALIRAARRVGIRITLFDAGYLTSGLDGGRLSPVQTRFSDGTVEGWLDRAGTLAEHYENQPDVRIGLAPHSVRAVPEAGLIKVGEDRAAGTPVHIHVSEQPAENLDSLKLTGHTPVSLLDRVGLLGPSTTAIHATHLTESDIVMLGESGTGVCYCATTERDLADGLGPAVALREAGSPLCIGSDSHAFIDPFEEARGLELHNRLITGRRGDLAPRHLLEAATSNGASALGFRGDGLAVGAVADFVAISTSTPRTNGFIPAEGLAQIVFSATAADVTDVFVGGNRVAKP